MGARTTRSMLGVLAAGALGVALGGPVLALPAGPEATPSGQLATPPTAGASAAVQPVTAGALAPTPPVDPGVAADGGALVAVEFTDIAPAAPTRAGTLSLSGTVLNRSEQTLTALNAYLRMSRVPTTQRSEIDQLGDPSFRPGFRPGPFVAVGSNLPPGASAQFRLDVPVAELGLTAPGVYPVGIEVLAGVEDGSRDVVGAARTVLPWIPPDAAAGTVEVALAVPLTAAVDRAPDGTYLTDELGALLAAGGGLDDALALPMGPAVTWLVDPALLEAAVDLADGYDVRADPADPTTAGPGAHAEDATAWLAAVSERLGPEQLGSGSVVLLPYGNPDLVALVRAGMDSDIVAALEAAPEVAARLDLDGDPLAGADATGLLYPPDGLVDAATLQVLGAAGVGGLLLTEEGIAANGPPPPVAALDIGGAPVAAATTDGALQDVLAAGSGPAQTRQLVLAHTALVALDRAATDSLPATPGLDGPATLVLVVPTPLPAGTAEALDVVADRAPWLTTGALDSALAAPGTAATVRYPDSAIAGELDQGYLGRVRALQDRAGLLADLTGDPGVALDRDLARLRTESAAWRGDLAQVSALVAARAVALDHTLGRVHIVTTGTVTLSSDSGRFPLTVANDLDVPVTVRLALAPYSPARLQTSTPDTIEIAPGAKTTVDVSAQATANGTYLVNARLQTPAGEPFGATTTIELRATDYDTVAWIVMGAAGALLVVGSGLRITRRVRGAHGEPAVRTSARAVRRGRA